MGYDLQNNPVPPYVYPYKASGGLLSTVNDIARFAIAEMAPANNGQPEVLSGESI
ncbi:MAG: serine hydrolase, partial [Aliifodinibius sp.]|nr:serine hydrolase [Fodinibius sp.]NIY29671.1 serine hydrolase [Fodinibius sp.]